MTDASQLVPNNYAVSSDLLYNLKPSSVPGRSYRASIPSSNNSKFNPGDVIILYIPGGRRNTFLDPTLSYLKFTITNFDASNLFIDNNAACIISRLDSYSGSNLLETIQQYNVLFSYLLDFQSNVASKYAHSAVYGEAPSLAGFRSGTQLATNTSITFCIPLISSVFGICSDKSLPLGLLGDDIRVEISLEAQLTAMVYSGATSAAWSVTGVELELTIIELSDQGMSVINSATPLDKPLYLHGNGYRHYGSSLPAQTSAGFYSTLVPARFASLKNLIVCPRRNTEIGDKASYSLSSRINPNISSYFFRCGPFIIPQKSVTLSSTTTKGYAEAYYETLKSFHMMNHADLQCSIGFEEYNIAETTDATVGGGTVTAGINGVKAATTGSTSYQNAFAIGQELEMFAFRNDILISGINTLASQVFFECNINAPTGAIYTLDFYACFDTIYVLENGLLSARY